MFWVYGSDNCPWCDKAVALLKANGHAVVYIDVGSRKEFRDPSWKTVPQIFDMAYHVGGFEDLVTYLEEHKDGC